MSLTEAYEDSSHIAVALGSFMTSWESGWCTLGVTVVSPPLMGSFSTVPSLLRLWMTLTVVYWSPKALEMALELLIGVSDFVSKLLLYIMAFIYELSWFISSGRNEALVWLVKLNPALPKMWLITCNSWFNKGNCCVLIQAKLGLGFFSLDKRNHHLKLPKSKIKWFHVRNGVF